MNKPAKLDDLLQAWELQMDEYSYFLDRQTGRVLSVSQEYIWIAQGLIHRKRLSDWETEAVETVFGIEKHSVRFVRLPEKAEIDDYGIMRDFSLQVKRFSQCSCRTNGIVSRRSIMGKRRCSGVKKRG